MEKVQREHKYKSGMIYWISVLNLMKLIKLWVLLLFCSCSSTYPSQAPSLGKEPKNSYGPSRKGGSLRSSASHDSACILLHSQHGDFTEEHSKTPVSQQGSWIPKVKHCQVKKLTSSQLQFSSALKCILIPSSPAWKGWPGLAALMIQSSESCYFSYSPSCKSQGITRGAWSRMKITSEPNLWLQRKAGNMTPNSSKKKKKKGK